MEKEKEEQRKDLKLETVLVLQGGKLPRCI